MAAWILYAIVVAVFALIGLVPAAPCLLAEHSPESPMMLASSNPPTISLDDPPLPLALDVSVSATVTYNPQTQRYTYVYKVRNLPTSTDTVDVFGVRQVLSVESIASPPHWEAFTPFKGDPNAVVWFCTDPGPPPPGWQDDSVSVYTSAFALIPGDSVTGFTLVSPYGPGTVQRLARKEPPLRNANQTVGQPSPPFWSVGVTGTTTGPISSIGIEEAPAPRPDQGLLRPAPNPFTDRRTITFDLSAPSDVELETPKAKATRELVHLR